jgi:hypothetical protein
MHVYGRIQFAAVGFLLLSTFVFGRACESGAVRGGSRAGSEAPTGLQRVVARALRDARFALQGYERTEGAAARQEEQRRAHEVSQELPELDFHDLQFGMLGHGERPVVSRKIASLEGARVRIRGYALTIEELAAAGTFVLHAHEYVDCLNELRPSVNAQVRVDLARGLRFDFTDSPLWVEGTLALGRFPTFADTEVALYALHDARYQELSPDDMLLPVLVPHPTGIPEQRREGELPHIHHHGHHHGPHGHTHGSGDRPHRRGPPPDRGAGERPSRRHP